MFIFVGGITLIVAYYFEGILGLVFGVLILWKLPRIKGDDPV